MRKITELLETMDVEDLEDLVKSYFSLGFSNKEILCLLAHQHAVIISKRTRMAGVLQSLAPTCLNTPACKFQVYLVNP